MSWVYSLVRMILWEDMNFSYCKACRFYYRNLSLFSVSFSRVWARSFRRKAASRGPRSCRSWWVWRCAGICPAGWWCGVPRGLSSSRTPLVTDLQTAPAKTKLLFFKWKLFSGLLGNFEVRKHHRTRDSVTTRQRSHILMLCYLLPYTLVFPWISLGTLIIFEFFF